jgi:hypothetical protein
MIRAAASSRNAGRFSGVTSTRAAIKRRSNSLAAPDRWLASGESKRALDPHGFLLEDGVPMLPAVGGQAVGSLRTRDHFHDPGLDQLPVGGPTPFTGRRRFAFEVSRSVATADSDSIAV